MENHHPPDRRLAGLVVHAHDFVLDASAAGVSTWLFKDSQYELLAKRES